jgi:uncharacterized protein (DUF3084 family)
MARLLECSRCGAGIGPNDTQCWRCGESLKNGAAPKAALSPVIGKISSPGIRDVRQAKPEEVRGQAQVRSISENFNSREREFQDREKELREEMDALEAESKELEKAALEMEKERLALEEARKRIKQREDDLDAMAIVLQSSLQAAEDYQRGVRAGDQGVEQIDP